VALPPGRDRLFTNPPPTGSLAIVKTIGMVEVACLNGGTPVPVVTMTLALRRTRSAASSDRRSARPSAQRYSIAMVRPSIQPSSRSRCAKAEAQAPMTDAVAGPRKPMIGGFCWARAAIGHAAAPPSSVKKSRRFTAQ
jgi:hypothetical protein